MRKLNALLMVCFALVFASTVQGQTGVNNAELNGNYAFTFNGLTGNANGSVVFAAVGRFTADGAGNVTNGELDTNGVGPGSQLTAIAFTGTYAIGADNRGVMTLNIPGGARLAFAMMANGNAQFIEIDAAGGTGTIGSGTMEKVDTTAYSTARITGDYAFGVAGFDNANNRAAIAGRFTSNGTGTLTSAAGDLNAYGSDYSMTFTAANYTVSNTATGRGTMNLAFAFGGTPDSLDFVFYVVNPGKLFVMVSDPVTAATPLLNGVVVQQRIPAGGFTNASLNGNMVIYLTGRSVCGGGTGSVPKAGAGLLTANGNGAFSLTYDENYCRAPNAFTDAPGTYSVASNGRTSITVGGFSLVAYLEDLNQIFLFVSDSNVLFGFGEPQAAGSFTNSALNGTYAGFATNPAAFGVVVFSGEFSADGATPTGNITGAEDMGVPSGPVSGATFKATYSVASSPTNGRGTMTVTSGTGGNAVFYMISASKFVAVSLNDPNPAVLIFEQSSAAPALSLSSLALNPTSVAGGNSSTGTVTLSGPAPAGGAQVTLSSSNTAAATVPSSVTVPAGATSATFTVSTSVVTASTAVTISAAYGGVTRTASITVAPAPPPPATLSSLTLSPTSVIGGTQSSTGTVTLSGAAPAGGAQVALSSSNTAAATVPSSVTVAAGATSATFTVSTSAVAASTAVTISAAYGGVTRTASITVAPAPPPPATLSSLTLSPTSVIGGTQSSTGTVTLSGAAPAGGATVALSSSNGAARVPSSVTVAAGATSATFTVSTSAVTASTAVTISAAYGGVTRTASITVAPAPPPPATVSSLTLNPTSVIGGLQTSTGTVTLSAAAPAGGATVALSSSNGAARVPSSVFVPAGATSATFTVSTSIVLLSTSATISASYNGTTRTAGLSVLL
ncbi:MAG TPA: hypothetical protein VEM60_04215 [Candidatus Dormibacteraeota bacterium]|nr:hypothetical protein [Candidatus Dormibacteraeota bacterium]